MFIVYFAGGFGDSVESWGLLFVVGGRMDNVGFILMMTSCILCFVQFQCILLLRFVCCFCFRVKLEEILFLFCVCTFFFSFYIVEYVGGSRDICIIWCVGGVIFVVKDMFIFNRVIVFENLFFVFSFTVFRGSRGFGVLGRVQGECLD